MTVVGEATKSPCSNSFVYWSLVSARSGGVTIPRLKTGVNSGSSDMLFHVRREERCDVCAGVLHGVRDNIDRGGGCGERRFYPRREFPAVAPGRDCAPARGILLNV